MGQFIDWASHFGHSFPAPFSVGFRVILEYIIIQQNIQPALQDRFKKCDCTNTTLCQLRNLHNFQQTGP